MASPKRKVLIRLAIYLPIIAALIAWQYWRDASADAGGAPIPAGEQSGTGSEPEPEPGTAAGYPHRSATGEEWRLSIAGLGARRLAKQQIWQPLNNWRGARGELVWWHDGERERVAYLPAPGETAEEAGPALFIALHRGRALGFGDPGFFERLGELTPSYALPEGWTVLTPPDGAP